MPLNRLLIHDGHVRRLTVMADGSGWDVREEQDTSVLRHVHRQDWHRVERDLFLFDLEARLLKRQGWREPDADVVLGVVA